jgi:hypothetical protein
MCEMSKIWLHKFITTMKSPFWVEVHNVSTHLTFLWNYLQLLSGSNLDFVFSNVGQKWTNIKKIITIDIESTNVNFTNHLTMHWKVVPFINAITDIEKYELQSQCYKCNIWITYQIWFPII